jgi:6-phosphogluconolactonase (cycloisomerase 2 family)
MNPAGTFAYVIINANSACPGSSTGILTFKVNSDGSTTVVGSLVPDPNPVALSMDAAGKFLFVAEGVEGIVDVYKIGSSASLTAAPATYTFPPTSMVPNIVAMAATPTIFPNIGINGVQNSVCSAPGLAPPTSEYLYAVDAQNYVVWEFSVDTSSGALGNPSSTTLVPSYPTDPIPAGVAVDPCNRFVYVSDSLTNKVSAYTICNGSNTQSPTCPQTPDGSLVQISGSPFSLSGSSNGPGPLLVDPYGNNVYVMGTLSNTISPLKISPISGSLTALTPATVATGSQPKSMAIRADDNWLFVTNYNPPTVSQYSITPATGALSVQPAFPTDNYPWGVAVK